MQDCTAQADDVILRIRHPHEKRKAEAQLEAKLLEGLNSAESDLTPADWSALRKEALARLEARKKQRYAEGSSARHGQA